MIIGDTFINEKHFLLGCLQPYAGEINEDRVIFLLCQMRGLTGRRADTTAAEAPVYFLERHLDCIQEDALKATLRQLPLQVVAIHHPDFKEPLLLGMPVLQLTAESLYAIYPERWPIEGIPQVGNYMLSGGGGRHYVHHPTAITRLPDLTMIFESLFNYLAAPLPPFRSGFWDRVVKPTYGRLMNQLKSWVAAFQPTCKTGVCHRTFAVWLRGCSTSNS